MSLRSHLSRVGTLAVAGALAFTLAARAQEIPSTGSWQITSSTKGKVDLEFSARTAHDSFTEGRDRSVSELHGLSPHALSSSGSDVHFVVSDAAGALRCDGHVGNGAGGGSFTYAPDPSFAQEWRARGLPVPTAWEQFRLALADFSFANLDALRRDGITVTPTLLVRAHDHGVSESYVRGIIALGYRGATLEQLIRLRDHGVGENYVSGLRKLGYTPTLEELVRLRDHGVSVEYAQRLRSHGYTPSVSELIRLRDSGV